MFLQPTRATLILSLGGESLSVARIMFGIVSPAATAMDDCRKKWRLVIVIQFDI
jgi:hypothetical protein